MFESKRSHETVTGDTVTSISEPKRLRYDEIVTDDTIFEHGREVLECDICGMFFFSQNILDAHVKRHTLQREYQCRTCGNEYTTADGLKLHTRSAHTEPCQREQSIQKGGGAASTDEPRQVCLRIINVLRVLPSST